MVRGIKLPVWSVAWLLPLCLSGCFHRSHPEAQAQKLAPPIQQPAPPQPPPQSAPANLPPPVVTVPAPPQPATAHNARPAAPAPQVRKKRVNRNREEAANAVPEVSAVGELSSGDPLAYRRRTAALIAATEHGLDSITRPLSASEQKTAEHIRQFLKQAKEALASGDVDGAHTLAAKAKVLLAELTG